MTHGGLIRNVVFILVLPWLAVFAQTNLVVNGSFEDGLNNWTVAPLNETGASGTCSYNAATAPGTETLTSTPGFPATDGTQIVLGSIRSTSGVGARTHCDLYQDILIPAGATSVTLTFDLGAKAGNDGCGNTGAFVGLYSTSAVPGLATLPVAGTTTSICTNTPSATLASFTSTKNVTSVAGTTVRLAFLNAANVNGGEVIGIDNVRMVAVISPPAITSVNPASGTTAGGNTVTITGTNFTGATSVTFGGVPATSFTVVNATTITAVVPPGTAGSISVVVTTPAGSNAANTLYAYVVPIPTLSEWGMIGLTGLLILYACLRLRRQEKMAGTV